MRTEEERAAAALELAQRPKKRKPAEVIPKASSSISTVVGMGIQRFGNAPAFENSGDGLRRFCETATNYLLWVADQNQIAESEGRPPIVPSVSQWCVYAGISRVTLSVYRKRSPEWDTLIEKVKEIILSGKEAAAAAGALNPTLFIFDSSNNHGMLDIRSFQPVEPAEERRMSASEIRKQIGLISEEDREDEQL